MTTIPSPEAVEAALNVALPMWRSMFNPPWNLECMGNALTAAYAIDFPAPQEAAPAGREPKDGEWWWVKDTRFHDPVECARFVKASMAHLSDKWAVAGLNSLSKKYTTPVAPVASPATVAALIEAMEQIRGTAAKTNGIGAGKWHQICVDIATSALAQGKADGLLEGE